MFDYEQLKMVIDADLLTQVGGVDVDYRDSVWRSGFSITAAKDLRTAGSGRCC